MERRGERDGGVEEGIGGTDAVGGKISSICTSLEIEPFKIRYSKHPSFACYSSCRHNKPEMEKGRKTEEGTK